MRVCNNRSVAAHQHRGSSAAAASHSTRSRRTASKTSVAETHHRGQAPARLPAADAQQSQSLRGDRQRMTEGAGALCQCAQNAGGAASIIPSAFTPELVVSHRKGADIRRKASLLDQHTTRATPRPICTCNMERFAPAHQRYARRRTVWQGRTNR